MTISIFEYTKAQIHQHVPAIRYAVDAELNLILEEWSGDVTRDALNAHWIEFLSDQSVLNCRRTIIDLTDAVMAFNGDDLYFLIDQLIKPALGDRKWITALIVESPLQFGISRQYGAYADFYSQDMIFATYNEAKEWIDSVFHME
jgi:hypothetical protein